MANKVIISKKPQEVFQVDPTWREYAVKQEDINESLLKIIYDIDDVKDILKHLEEDYHFDRRRKHIFFYSNKDIDGLKHFMQYTNYSQNEPEILE